jgi:hypothetical protein
VPTGTSVEGQSATVVLFFAALLFVSVLVGAVVVCETGACKKRQAEGQQQQLHHEHQPLPVSEPSAAGADSAAAEGLGGGGGGQSSFIGRRADAVTVAGARRQESRSIALAKARRDAHANGGGLELQSLTHDNNSSSDLPLEASIDDLVLNLQDDGDDDGAASDHAAEA